MPLKVPPAGDPIWAGLVSGKRSYQLEFLAAKVMLGRIIPHLQNNPNPATVQVKAKEVQELYATNAHLPSAQRDLAKLLG